MSSDRNGDLSEYVTDNAENEDATLFLPATDGGGDPWTYFFIGILTGLAGSVLVPVSAWLAGLLILIGYGITAGTLRNSRNSFAKSLCFGFAVAALVGGLLIAGQFTVPLKVGHYVTVLGDRHLIFPSLAVLPWALGLLKFLLTLVLGLGRPSKTHAA